VQPVEGVAGSGVEVGQETPAARAAAIKVGSIAASSSCAQRSSTYENGVLVLRIPIAEKAKPRKIAVAGRKRTDQKKVITG